MEKYIQKCSCKYCERLPEDIKNLDDEGFRYNAVLEAAQFLVNPSVASGNYDNYYVECPNKAISITKIALRRSGMCEDFIEKLFGDNMAHAWVITGGDAYGTTARGSNPISIKAFSDIRQANKYVNNTCFDTGLLPSRNTNGEYHAEKIMATSDWNLVLTVCEVYGINPEEFKTNPEKPWILQ